MAISFGETFTKVQECFQEPAVSSLWTARLQSITILRDVYGLIRLYLEHDDSFQATEADITTLETSLSQKLGSYYGKDIWLPQGEQDGYQPLIKVIIDERVAAKWDDDTVSPRWYILERHVAKKAWTDKDSGCPPWEQEYVDRGHQPAIVTFFLSAPIRELLAFWLDKWRRWERIRPKIFLRTDLFREDFLGFPDASKLRTHQSNLEWKPLWLYQLLFKRLANSGSEMAEYLRIVPNLINDTNSALGITTEP